MYSKEVIVSLALGNEIIRIGKLWFHQRRGLDRASFEYDNHWLTHRKIFFGTGS